LRIILNLVKHLAAKAVLPNAKISLTILLFRRIKSFEDNEPWLKNHRTIELTWGETATKPV
jgi:hypothetical protein